jgi:DNA repair exonuclease SbcCD nuclease subunit
MGFFKKAALFGDIHFGQHSDSSVFNQDCLRYIEWFCQNAATAGVDRIIFLGDWFHNPVRIKLETLDAGVKALKMLREVAPVEMLVGNHDMMMKHSRDGHSVQAYDEWKDVRVHNSCTVLDGAGMVPFLVGTEYTEVIHMDAQYLFGHFEFPRFMTNSSVEFKDHGQFNSDQVLKPKMVFSGHFHKRQMMLNKAKIPVWYIGSPFGHSFSDVGETERGMMLLEWDGVPEFIDWKEGPIYQRFVVSDIVTMLENGSITENTRPTSILEVHDDVGLELEDVNLVRQELSAIVRETRLIPMAANPGMDMDTVMDEFDDRTLEDVVVGQLEQIDPHGSDIEPALLVELFKGKSK